MKRITIAFGFLLVWSLSHAQDSVYFYYDQGVAALKANDLQTYRSAFQAADRIRPYHPTLLQHLAKANALLDDEQGTYETVRTLALMSGTLNILEDSVFAEFSKSAKIADLKTLVEKVNATKKQSTTYITLDTKTLHPEAMTHDGKNFYLGGVHDRKIIRFTPKGETEELLSVKDQPYMYAVMGLDYDAKNKLLWVCTGALPEMSGYDESMKGKSSVFAIDAQGKVVRSDTISGNHFFGDLIVDKSGLVYISDAADNSIYTISMETDLEEKFDFSDRTYNLQGLAFDDDERYLYLSDYILGLYRVDMKTGELSALPLRGDLVAKGIDGLYFYKNSLIAIQNGTDPDRVWRFHLDKSGTSVIRNEVIDQALEVFGEPTQGLIKNGALYYIANSPWPLYEEGELLIEQVPETVILIAELSK